MRAREHNMRLCRLADAPEDFRRPGVDPGSVAAWEDELRTDGAPGSYERWYFDAQLDDGTRTERLAGVGYHDHNWGDVAMPRLMNHCYWGRAQAGAYSVIARHTTAEHRYGGVEMPIFLLTKGETIVADDATKVRFLLQDEHTDEQSGKPIADVVIYEYDDGHDRYRLSFHRTETIMDRELIDEVTGLKHLLARLMRFDGAYLRFTGNVRLEHFVEGSLLEDVSDHDIWELMYFGHTDSQDDKSPQHA